MGIYYYIVNHKNKTFFEMGKAYTFTAFVDDYGDYWKIDKEFLRAAIKDYYEPEDERDEKYVQYLSLRIWRFLDGAESNQISIVHDAGDEYYDLRYAKDEHGQDFRDEARGGHCGIVYRIVDGRFNMDNEFEHWLETGEFKKYRDADD